MTKHNHFYFILILIILLTGSFLVSCGSSGTTTDPFSSGATDGQTLMQERCSVCHSLDRVITAHKTAEEWTISVDRMISHGAQLNAQEEQILINYLAANYK